MGAGMARRWHDAGYEVVAFNRTASTALALQDEGIVVAADSVAELVSRLEGPRIVYVMLPSGEVTETMLLGQDCLVDLLADGDVIVDGGNSNYLDSVRRAKVLADKGIRLVDQGTSGGILGVEQGYCVMLGGADEAVSMVEPLAKAMAMEGGYIHAGASGAGHYVKMVHNGMEYGMMQALAEGFNLMSQGPYPIELNELAKTWQYGSILQSLLLEVLTDELGRHGDLNHASPEVSDSGEGRWTIEEALRVSVPLPVITAALFARYDSRGQAEFAGRVLSAMRLGFGGHKS
jgi:6-phosphogluconate dehydrogenase